MSIIINKNTSGLPMSQAGRTGVQSFKYVPAPRVYVKASDSITAAPVQDYFTKSNGVTPTGWTDLGTVQGAAKLTYNAKVKEIQLGVDNRLYGAYLDNVAAQCEFSLVQFDDVAVETVSGMTASVITAGSVVNYAWGQTDLNQLALLLVVQNKLNGKEWQFYNPNAYLNFTFDEQGDGMQLKVTSYLPFFVAQGQTQSQCLSSTVFA